MTKWTVGLLAVLYGGSRDNRLPNLWSFLRSSYIMALSMQDTFKGLMISIRGKWGFKGFSVRAVYVGIMHGYIGTYRSCPYCG